MLKVGDLDQSEIKALASCNNFSELIAVKLDEKGKSRIVTVNRSEVTCWQLLLKFFGAGKFADTELHLNKIAGHLNEYDWKAVAKDGSETDTYRAYLKVCTLANKALVRKFNPDLYENVSVDKVYVPVYRHNKEYCGFPVYWNPDLRYEQIIRLARCRYQYTAMMTVERPRSFSRPDQGLVTLDALKDAKIYIGIFPQDKL